MTSQKGDTAVYLLYSYVRLGSIIRNSGISIEDIKNSDFNFTDSAEISIARHLVKFSETLEFAADKMALNYLCNYIYNLSTKVSSAISNYFINNNENTAKRVKLIYCAREVMKKCFDLLGIETVEKI